MSVISGSINFGNYTFDYQVIQVMGGRDLNNNFLKKIVDLSGSLAQSIYEVNTSKPRAIDETQYNVLEMNDKRYAPFYNEGTGSGERGSNDYNFIVRFDCGGGGREVSRCYLDKESLQYSAYNVQGYRKLKSVKSVDDEWSLS